MQPRAACAFHAGTAARPVREQQTTPSDKAAVPAVSSAPRARSSGPTFQPCVVQLGGVHDGGNALEPAGHQGGREDGRDHDDEIWAPMAELAADHAHVVPKPPRQLAPCNPATGRRQRGVGPHRHLTESAVLLFGRSRLRHEDSTSPCELSQPATCRRDRCGPPTPPRWNTTSVSIRSPGADPNQRARRVGAEARPQSPGAAPARPVAARCGLGTGRHAIRAGRRAGLAAGRSVRSRTATNAT